MMKMFEVGGCVRDEILGVPSKDIDFSVVLDEQDRWIQDSAFYDDPYTCMVLQLERMGFTIFRDKKGDPISMEHQTARGKFPKRYSVYNEAGDLIYKPEYNNLSADFVLARKEGKYSDGRRPDSVEPGTLDDDLRRRDFTMNAIAKAADGSYIDPFNGRADIDARIIRAVGDPFERLTEDALRAVRALRFSVTKGFTIEPSLRWAMESAAVVDAVDNKISDERIRDELEKMFRFDTVASLRAMSNYSTLTDAVFAGRVSLDATMKTKGRGK